MVNLAIAKRQMGANRFAAGAFTKWDQAMVALSLTIASRRTEYFGENAGELNVSHFTHYFTIRWFSRLAAAPMMG